MKYLALIVVLVALGWFGFTRFFANSESAIAAAPVASAVKPAAPALARAPAPTAVTTPAPAPQIKFVQASAPEAAPAAPNPNAPVKIDLAQALGADNRYRDTAVGVEVQFPGGWKVQDAIRWGNNQSENTVFLSPDTPSSARPSMYYKPYLETEAATISGTGAEALLREQAEKKEASRVAGLADYKNVPDSFSFFDVNGRPAMSYFATFTNNGEVMTEHFIRILGPKGYVMFFTTGRFEDVKALMPQLKQAATTVKGP